MGTDQQPQRSFQHEAFIHQNAGLCQRLYLSRLPRKRCAGEHRSPFAGPLPPPLFHRCGRHHLHLRPGDGRRRRTDAHLQRRRQRSPDVRQRRPLRGRVALHPRRRQRDARRGHQQRYKDHHPQGPPALAGGDGRILRHGGGSARREYGRRPAGGLLPHRGGQDLARHLHQRGQPPLRHRRGRCGQPQARGHRPGVREAPELPGAGQHRVRAGGGLHPPENAGVGAGQRRNLGLRHRHLCHRGGADRAGRLPRRGGRPRPAARR